jgi:hypothetical protein
VQHRLSGVERTSHREYSTDLATGVITPLGNTFTNPHGLLFVPAGQHQNDDDHPEGED